MLVINESEAGLYWKQRDAAEIKLLENDEEAILSLVKASFFPDRVNAKFLTFEIHLQGLP